MNTNEIMNALEIKFGPPEYAFFSEVRRTTGFGYSRTADAIAMNLWPSRGLDLHGFEVKASRGDWLNEMKNPAKAEQIAAFCDRWWLVVGDKNIVKEGELPAKWGLIVPRGRGLSIIKKALELKPKPIDRNFLASLLKRLSQDTVSVGSIQKRLHEQYEKGREANKYSSERIREKLADLQKDIATFEKISGVKITSHYGGGLHYGIENIGAAVKLVTEYGHGHIIEEMEFIRQKLGRIIEGVDEGLKMARSAPGFEEKKNAPI